MKTLHNNGEQPYQALDKHQTPARMISIPPGEARSVSDQLFARASKTFDHLAGQARKAAAGDDEKSGESDKGGDAGKGAGETGKGGAS